MTTIPHDDQKQPTTIDAEEVKRYADIAADTINDWLHKGQGRAISIPFALSDEACAAVATELAARGFHNPKADRGQAHCSMHNRMEPHAFATITVMRAS